MGKYAATWLVVLAFGVPTISAETPASVKEILRGPVGYLFTKGERKALENLKSEADVNRFMELFWAKRDPDLNTWVNEFKVNFEARVKAADTMFTLERMPGSLTDRGRVLILLGKPTRATNIPAGSVVEGARGGEGGGRAYEDRGATELWVYTKDTLPEGIFKTDEVLVVFTETRVGSNEFILDRTDRRNVAIMKILADLPEKLIKNPKLTEVPKMGLLPGSKAAKPEELAILEKGEAWPDGAHLVMAQGLVSAKFSPLWLFLQLPDSVAPAASVIGRVSTEQGQELGTFSRDVTPLSVTGGRGYEFSLPLDAGKFQVDLALLDASGTPLVVKRLPVELQPVPEDGTVISQLYWGVDVRQEASAHLGDPFNIGGWHVIPRASNAYSSSENLAYFCYILHPQLDENGKPDFVVSLAAYKEDKKLTENPNQPVNLSQVTGDLWMFGNGLPLSVFRKEGEYLLEVTLRDAKSNVERKARIPLVIAGQ